MTFILKIEDVFFFFPPPKKTLKFQHFLKQNSWIKAPQVSAENLLSDDPTSGSDKVTETQSKRGLQNKSLEGPGHTG